MEQPVKSGAACSIQCVTFPQLGAVAGVLAKTVASVVNWRADGLERNCMKCGASEDIGGPVTEDRREEVLNCSDCSQSMCNPYLTDDLSWFSSGTPVNRIHCPLLTDDPLSDFTPPLGEGGSELGSLIARIIDRKLFGRHKVFLLGYTEEQVQVVQHLLFNYNVQRLRIEDDLYTMVHQGASPDLCMPIIYTQGMVDYAVAVRLVAALSGMSVGYDVIVDSFSMLLYFPSMAATVRSLPYFPTLDLVRICDPAVKNDTASYFAGLRQLFGCPPGRWRGLCEYNHYHSNSHDLVISPILATCQPVLIHAKCFLSSSKLTIVLDYPSNLVGEYARLEYSSELSIRALGLVGNHIVSYLPIVEVFVGPGRNVIDFDLVASVEWSEEDVESCRMCQNEHCPLFLCGVFIDFETILGAGPVASLADKVMSLKNTIGRRVALWNAVDQLDMFGLDALGATMVPETVVRNQRLGRPFNRLARMLAYAKDAASEQSKAVERDSTIEDSSSEVNPPLPPLVDP